MQRASQLGLVINGLDCLISTFCVSMAMRKLKAYMFISAHVYNIDGTDGISLLTPIPFSPQSNKQNDEHANYTRYNYCIQRDNNIVNRGTISS
jgi:hypothetical protein